MCSAVLQVFVLLFIFVKRQIMRFAMKSRRGPHVPLGHNAPKCVEANRAKGKHLFVFVQVVIITSSECKRWMPSENQSEQLSSISSLDVPFQDLCGSASALTGRRYRKWLQDLRNSHSLFKTSHGTLLDRLLDGYDNARHGTGVFGEAEFVRYKEDLAELAELVKSQSSCSSLNQHHQSAAKDLTGSGPSSTSSIQVTYLPSSGQRSKRSKHFLELKSFKDNYNTLESTL
ncbi:hypothetical protein DNTS_020631 [Danionella cerebrum]|uniref:Uncharacterized protein n=1 Tax=Danionella cerebrum TaxID=2873325 RepID=A0A553PYI7_9TELE|nr:hypothetical protein DNTS_020631 [Danionella translucida]